MIIAKISCKLVSRRILFGSAAAFRPRFGAAKRVKGIRTRMYPDVDNLFANYNGWLPHAAAIHKNDNQP